MLKITCADKLARTRVHRERFTGENRRAVKCARAREFR